MFTIFLSLLTLVNCSYLSNFCADESNWTLPETVKDSDLYTKSIEHICDDSISAHHTTDMDEFYQDEALDHLQSYLFLYVSNTNFHVLVASQKKFVKFGLNLFVKVISDNRYNESDLAKILDIVATNSVVQELYPLFASPDPAKIELLSPTHKLWYDLFFQEHLLLDTDQLQKSQPYSSSNTSADSIDLQSWQNTHGRLRHLKGDTQNQIDRLREEIRREKEKNARGGKPQRPEQRDAKTTEMPQEAELRYYEKLRKIEKMEEFGSKVDKTFDLDLEHNERNWTWVKEYFLFPVTLIEQTTHCEPIEFKFVKDLFDLAVFTWKAWNGK